MEVTGDPGPARERVARVEQRLAELERASDRRRAELRTLAEQLPPALSRRQLVIEAARDVRSAPNKGQIAGRAVIKLVRAPIVLITKFDHRSS